MAKKGNKLKKLSEGALRKKYAGSGKASEIMVSGENMLWLPSRFLTFNDQLGGGVPFGKILELFGEESSGKSLLAYDFAYCCQALGGVVLWADSEFAFTHDWAIQNGLDLDQVELFQEKAIENISDWAMDMALFYRSQLTNNEPILLVVDSIAALDCIDNIDSHQLDAKAEMGNRAKAIDKMLRTRNGLFEKLGVAVVLINQLRSKIGASKFEDPDTTPGGKATKFYASQRVGVYGGKQIKAKIKGYEDRVGRVTSIRVKKNKVAPPKPTIKSAEVYFHPEHSEPIGFSKYFGLPDILVRKGVLDRKKGSSRYYLADKMVANGEAALLKLLKSDEKMRRKLIRKSGINTISTTRKKLEGLTTNRFNVDALDSKDLEKQSEE